MGNKSGWKDRDRQRDGGQVDVERLSGEHPLAAEVRLRLVDIGGALMAAATDDNEQKGDVNPSC